MNSVIRWQEPNRSKMRPLHIAGRGKRYSTLTGAAWLDEHRIVVNHQCGQRVALFDLRSGLRPVTIAEVPHRNDDVAARPLGDGRWEVAVSGCWSSACSVFELCYEARPWLPWLRPSPRFRLKATHASADRSFAHGIAYDHEGRIWLAFNAGERPRIEVLGERCWQLPEPWGPRDVCFDDEGNAYAVATSHNADFKAYDSASLSIWRLDASGRDWTLLTSEHSAHTDACQIRDHRIWVNDQIGDKMLGIDLQGIRPTITVKDDSLSFPHGLAISAGGIMAVTNYGNSSVSLLDMNEFLHPEPSLQV